MTEPTPAPERPPSRLRRHFFSKMISGMLVLIPFAVTYVVVRFLFRSISGFAAPLLDRLAPPQVPDYALALASAVVFLVFLYIVGLVSTQMVGKKLLHVGEALFLRLPLVKTIYSSTKAAISAISFSQKATFRSVVMLQFPRPDFWSMGFVTGATTAADGRRFFRVFVPTAPNPTTGFFLVVSEADVVPTEFSVEEGIQVVVSGGILFPSTLPPNLPPVGLGNRPGGASASGPHAE